MSFGVFTYKVPFHPVPRDPNHVCGFCGSRVNVEYVYNVDSSERFPEASRVDDTSIYSCSSCTLRQMWDIPDNRLEYDFNITDPYKFMKTLQRMYNDVDKMRNKFNSMWSYCCGCKTYVRTETEVTGITDNNRHVLRCGICGSIHKFLD